MFRTALISMFLTSTALAEVWTVDDDGKADFDNIQAAVDAASDGDEILVMPGTYTSTQDGHVVNMLGKAVTLRSSDPSDPLVVAATIIDGEGSRRGLACFNNETSKTIISGFTIANGVSVEFDYNGNGDIDSIEGNGGGMCILNSSPTLTACTFTNNTAPYGGGMSNWQSSPTLTTCTFDNNTAWNGGGMYNGVNSNPTLTGCTFTNNTTVHDENGGGGMSNDNSDPELTNCTFTSNNANGYGGGMMNRWYSSPTLTDCTFTSNISDYYGGGMENNRSSVTLTDCTFHLNSTTYAGGGGISHAFGDLTLTNCIFTQNTASWDAGGGLGFDYYPTVTLNNCTFDRNTADSGGGIAGQGNVVMTGCSFTENIATSVDWWSGGGGAISSAGSQNQNYVLIDCTAAGNIAENQRGDGMSIVFNVILIGTNTLDDIYVRNSSVTSSITHHANSITTLSNCIISNPENLTLLDLDKLNMSPFLSIADSYSLEGGLSITNDSGSLMTSNAGDRIPLAQASTLTGNFDSIVFPPMPEGLGLQLNEYPALRGGDTEMVAEVIEVDEADFGDPFSGDLASPPIDVISFDADGDGRDEVAVLFGGTPGGVAGYSVSQDGTPTPIDGLVAIVGNDPVSIDAADLNNDGREDLIVANSTDNSISVLLTMEDIDGSLYFDVTVIKAPGSNQAITCVAAIDWDGDTDLDVVVGVDIGDENLEDGYQVLLNVSGNMSHGDWFEIPEYQLPDDSYVPDPPTCVEGGDQTSAWGFVGGTRYGRVHRGTSGGSLQVISELGGKNTVTIEAIELDANGGDGQIDLMVSSDEAEVIYLFQGNAAESDGFNDLIPLGVSLPVEDVIAIDADDDGDMDIVMTAPDSDTPVILLRNDGASGGLLPSSLGGQTWSMQIINSASDVTRLTSGGLSPKDDEDDWIVGGGSSTGFRGETIGVIEQSNILLGSRCDADVSGDGEVNVTDLLAVIDQWGSTDSDADISGDGIVNVTDLLEVVGNWGPCE